MKLDDKPEIDEKWFDANYVITLTDIMATNVCQQGYCIVGDNKTLKAILHLMGMDIHRPITETVIDSGASVRSQITGLVQHGGLIFQGYVRRDPAWVKNGLKITEQYLFGSGSDKVINMIKESNGV